MSVWLKRLWQRWLSRRIPPARRVTLNQKRIFIIPTRMGVAFVGALMLMLLAAINYQNSLAYGLTFLLGSLFLLSIFHTYRNLAGITLQAGTAGAVFAGDRAGVPVQLISQKQAFTALSVGFPAQNLVTVDVPERGETHALLSIQSTQRGWLQLGRVRVETRYPLGLFVAWSWVDLAQRVLVYPRPLAGELPQLGGADADQHEQGARLSKQGVDDYQGLKAYQSGDSKRRLHWKAYSRGQGLHTKDFAELSGEQNCLDFDLIAGDVETRLSLLCHWVLTLTEQQQSFALRLPNRVFEMAGGEAHRDACLHALALHGCAS